ncbi:MULTISPECIES: ABC transporter permease [Geobacillus]|uniref:ABC transporter permease n=1 Tax=Geobacillus TaxID=129337 RepID=UPI0027DE00B8|nr:MULTISPECIES: ABC transporter permease [Geobacillus thermoleovorans group]MBW7644346.1 ABC transporter permease [Geobacillus thermoleovorans]WMJ21449.1 ABC transporter permease [Geobacillus kaustophilus]
MSAKRLSANRAMWTQNVRQIGWIAIIHLLLWLAAIVLPIGLSYSQYDPKVGNVPQWKNVYYISNGFETLIAWLVPILAAAGVLRYMHEKRSADFIHSLPIRRTELLVGQVLFGWMLLIVPLAVTALAAIGCLYGLDLPWPIGAADVGRWFGETLVMETVIFAFSIVMGVLVGQSVLHIVLTNTFLVFPAGIMVLMFSNLSLLLYGFPDMYYLSSELEQWVMPIRYAMLTDQAMSAGEIGMLLLLSLLFFSLSIWLYERRPTEAAGQALAFSVLRPLFVYGVAFCSWLVGGFYFGNVESKWNWTIFGYISFSLIGYAIAQMVIAKTWRVFHRWKGYIAFAGAMGVICLLVHFDPLGYEQRVPALADIKQVYFGQSAMNFEHPEMIGRSFEEVDQFLRSQENIKAVRAFHEQLVHDQPSPPRFANIRTVVIGYVLKDGTRLLRRYVVPIEPYMPYFQRIMGSKEYKQQYYLLLRPSGYAPIRQVTIRNVETGRAEVVLAEPKEIESFVQALKQDLWNEPVEDIIGGGSTWQGNIELLQSDGDSFTVPLSSHSTHVREWLQQQHHWEQIQKR